ncbi:hypothetical protein BBJ28_00009917 [Nothophytophthora sp. Chile5]|nr:hypothetical protein BBJ28_00009917 [Nothophytophthora sp. Chile5]
MSSYERDPAIGADAGAAGAEKAGGSLATTAASTTTTAAQAATSGSSSSAGGSPDSLADDARTQGAGGGGRQPSSSSDGSSPLRRLPSVLRPPPASAAASLSSTQPAAARPQTQAQAQRVTRSPQRPLAQSAGPTSSATNNRDLMGRRHLFQPPTQAVSAALPQMQPQYFVSDNGGRLTTGNNSGYRHHLSPMSSPPMGGEAWARQAQSQSAMNSAAGGSGRGLKRHLQPPFDSYARGDGYLARTSGGVGPASRTARQAPSSAAPQQQQQPMTSDQAAAKTPSTGMAQQASTSSSMRPSNSVGGSTTTTTTSPSSSGSNLMRARQLPQQMQQQQSMGYGTPPHEDPLQYEPSGEARHPRDAARYETWTSKQLRKKCSHLKLRGLKNVKKHVMVEALYRYYRTQRLRDIADASSSNLARGGGDAGAKTMTTAPSSTVQRRTDGRKSSISGSSSGGRPDQPSASYRPRYDQPRSGPQSGFGSRSSRSRHYDNYNSQSPSPPSSGADSGSSQRQQYASPGATNDSRNSRFYLDEESKQVNAQYKEVPVTSEDVIRLVDVVLSAEFVDRLTAEISRWQFWVDIREMYIALLRRQHAGGSAGSTSGTGSSVGGPVGSGGSATNSRNFKWSSMQLWEIWKELSFAYTKTCFEFTAAGMKSEHTLHIASALLGEGPTSRHAESAAPLIDGDGREAATRDPHWMEPEELTACAVACVVCARLVAGVDERDYINFCDGRPDVYYLHQRLHARPDLLHLIKSNEYIDEKCTSEASESIALEQQQLAQQQQSGGGATSSPMMRAHKRYKRSGPMVGPADAAGGYGGSRVAYQGTSNAAGSAGAGVGAPDVGGNASSGQGSGDSQGNSPNAQEENSTENSETTGEEGSSSNTANSNASRNSSADVSLRAALAEQKYFGLLLQNFEVIFESLHNKKVLLATLRKDSKAPDHLVADLHDDIHVLSALKKDFRNKLRRTMQ